MLPARDEEGEGGAESLDCLPEPSRRLLEGALREGIAALGDLDAKLDEEDCLGGGCRSNEVTLSRRDRFESSEENADVGTVSRNRNTPFEDTAALFEANSESEEPACRLLLTGLLLFCLPSAMTRASRVSWSSRFLRLILSMVG